MLNCKMWLVLKELVQNYHYDYEKNQVRLFCIVYRGIMLSCEMSLVLHEQQQQKIGN